MHFTELFSREDLDEMIQAGYVTVRNHLNLPLQILNYSDTCQYAQMWNDVTKNCRGLIIDTDGNVVARGFPKFFNYGQPGAAEIPLDAPVEVTDKADGSLGIIYPVPGGYAVATRGSFHSDQAIKATEMLQETAFYPHPNITTLVEIIYPDNRIVLDYGNEEKLLMLGGVSIETGWIYGPRKMARFNGWVSHNVVETFSYSTLADALAAPPRSNAEGLVVRHGKDMVKIKQEDYIRLHKLVFGLSEKAVWEHLSTHDGDITGMLDGLPDEFHGWVKKKSHLLLQQYSRLFDEVCYLFDFVNHYYGDDRRAFAEKAKTYPEFRQYLFMLLDGKDISGAIWKSLKPKGSTPMVRMSEDVA